MDRLIPIAIRGTGSSVPEEIVSSKNIGQKLTVVPKHLPNQSSSIKL